MITISERDISAVKNILSFCNTVSERIQKHNMTYDEFILNSEYQDLLGMPIMQIGEFAKRLSKEFTDIYKEIPWSDIRDMRNIHAHEYLNLNLDYVWSTAVDDIPGLRKFCESVLKEIP